MISVLVNTLTVLLGSMAGLLLKKGVPTKITDSLMTGLGLCTIAIGIAGVLKGENDLVMILAMCIGAAIGTLLNLDGKLSAVSQWVERKFPQKDNTVSVANGFMTGSMLFCIGSMTIVGSLQAGLTGDCTMIYTKSLMDMVAAFTLSTTLGVGVALSSVFVLTFQGLLVLCAQFVSPLFTDYVIAEITCVGSLMIIAVGLNLLGITKIKTANFLPAIFVPIVLCMFM